MPTCEEATKLRKETKIPKFTARQSRQLSRIEDELQLRIIRDAEKPKSKLRRVRKMGETLLHSKGILILVVLLNSLDCVLVLTELILDVAFVRGMIETAENTMETFNFILQEKYPEKFKDVPVYDTHIFYNGVLQADLIWNNASVSTYFSSEGCNGTRVKRASEPNPHVVKRVVLSRHFEPSDDPEFLRNDPEFFHDNIDKPEEIVSHAFHKASIIILGILVVYIVLKVFCLGRAIFRKKLELFDAFVVICSFTADIYFIDGLTNYPLSSFVLIVSLAIPWRVIRVLNSLVISVKDKFTFQMKLMYKKNKIQTDKIAKLKFDREHKQGIIDSLLKLCKAHGIPNSEFYELMDYQSKPKADKIKPQAQLFSSCFGLARPSVDFVPEVIVNGIKMHK